MTETQGTETTETFAMTGRYHDKKEQIEVHKVGCAHMRLAKNQATQFIGGFADWKMTKAEFAKEAVNCQSGEGEMPAWPVRFMPCVKAD
jgi:hypothetical protein